MKFWAVFFVHVSTWQRWFWLCVHGPSQNLARSTWVYTSRHAENIHKRVNVGESYIIEKAVGGGTSRPCREVIEYFLWSDGGCPSALSAVVAYSAGTDA